MREVAASDFFVVGEDFSEKFCAETVSGIFLSVLVARGFSEKFFMETVNQIYVGILHEVCKPIFLAVLAARGFFREILC